MEGSPDDDKQEVAPKKKSETAFGLGKGSLESANRKDKTEEIAKAPLWEKLLPKEAVSSDKAEESTAEVHEDLPDASVEKIVPEEVPEVVKAEASELLAVRKAEAPAPEGTVEAEMQQESIDFLEQVIENPDMIAVEVNAEAEDTAEDEGELEADDGEEEPAEFEHGQEINFNEAEGSVEATDAEDDQSQQTNQAAATPPPVTPPPPTNPNTTGNTGNQPPVPPVVPPSPPIGPGAAPTPPGGGSSVNVYPLNANPNAAPPVTRVEYVRDRRSEGAYFLAGGILGYLLGRRRGRIKTEKRMNVVKKKLEKQIDDVRKQVARQEVTIREQARDRFNQAHARTEAPRGAETTAARTAEVSRKVETVTQLTGTEVAVNRRQAAERLGVSEAVATATAERVQSMDHREVLAVAEKVVIDGTSLRTIYESKQITEPGLRRLTREYLRGGDLKSALRQELQVKEMQYEKDPQMRDRLAASYAGVDAAQPMSATESMAAFMEQGGEPKKSASQDTGRQADDDSQAAKDGSQKLLVSAWAVLLIVLVIVAVVLAAR